MRVIKFRAWNTETNHMIINSPISMSSIMRDHIRRAWDANGNRIGSQYKIMQYIGVRDRKRTNEFPIGQEIYAGDRVSFDGNMTADNSFGFEPNGYVYDENSIHTVIWNEELAAWDLDFDKDEHWKYKRDTRSLLVQGHCEVIGNIYGGSG